MIVYVNEIKDNNDTGDGRKKLGLFCLYKINYLRSDTVLLESGLGIHCKCILQTVGQLLKKKFKKKYNWYAKKGEKMKSYKMLNKSIKDKKKSRKQK